MEKCVGGSRQNTQQPTSGEPELAQISKELPSVFGASSLSITTMVAPLSSTEKRALVVYGRFEVLV
jgi:hypothetical protein